jgi:hypothetical protein
MLIDGGIYPKHYKYMDPDGPQKPNNLDEVVQRLSQPQPAISSTVLDHEFREYTKAIPYASKDNAVKASVIPMFLRAIGSSDIVQKNVRFNNLTSPADSLKEEDLGKAKSDFYYGCQPEQVNANVRKTLSRHIVPSSLTNLPIAPNFFMNPGRGSGRRTSATGEKVHDSRSGTRMSVRSGLEPMLEGITGFHGLKMTAGKVWNSSLTACCR